MVDLDLLDEEALRKLQTLLKKRDQENLEAASITLVNQSFDAKTLEEESVLFRKYPHQELAFLTLPDKMI